MPHCPSDCFPAACVVGFTRPHSSFNVLELGRLLRRVLETYIWYKRPIGYFVGGVVVLFGCLLVLSSRTTIAWLRARAGLLHCTGAQFVRQYPMLCVWMYAISFPVLVMPSLGVVGTSECSMCKAGPCARSQY